MHAFLYIITFVFDIDCLVLLCVKILRTSLGLFKAGFDHPHMRAPGLPASLTSISGGKP